MEKLNHICIGCSVFCFALGMGDFAPHWGMSVALLALGAVLFAVWMGRPRKSVAHQILEELSEWQEKMQQHTESSEKILTDQSELFQRLAQQWSDMMEASVEKQDQGMETFVQHNQQALKSLHEEWLSTTDDWTDILEKTSNHQMEVTVKQLENLEYLQSSSGNRLKNMLQASLEDTQVHEEALAQRMEQLSNQYAAFEGLTQKMMEYMALMSQEDQVFIKKILEKTP